jgi:O-antigen/teichoic acid export membrane protein
MHLLSVIRRDILSKFAGEIFSRGLFLLFFFYAGRKLGTTDFGVLNVALSTTYILGVLFLDTGMNLSTIQFLVADPGTRDKTASAVFTFKLLAYPLMALTMWALSRAMGNRLPAFATLLLASFFALFTSLFEYLCSVTNAYHRMDLEAWLKIFNRICMILFGFVALRLGHTVAVLWAISIATFLACVLTLFVLRRRLVSIYLFWDSKIIAKVLKAGLPIAGTLIVGTIYLKWDLLVLSYFKVGKQEIGWYAGAFKIVEAFSALPTLLGAALFPMILQLRPENPAALDRLLFASTKAVLLFSIPVAATISLFSRQIISIVYGPSYLPGAAALAIIIWCIVPIFLFFFLMFVNVAAGHAKANLLSACAALIAGLIVNVILVPRIGYLGTAWAALIANSSFAVLATWRVCTLFREASIPPMLLKLFIAGGLMVAVGSLVPASILIQFGLGLLVFVTALIVTGSLGTDDLSLVLRMFQARIQPQTEGP